MMRPIRVTCDSSSDLPRAVCEKYRIEQIPLGITADDRLYYDGVDITADELFAYVERTGRLPKTSAVSIGEYMAVFKKYTDQGFQVIHLSLSGELSSCYQNACLAAEATGDVTVVDSRSLSTGTGYLAILATELASADLAAEEIVSILNDMKGRLDVSFVIQTLDYLHKGGRCSGVAVLGANLMKLRPEIVMTNGTMHVGRKYRGDLEKSVLAYVRGRLADNDNVQHDYLFITHSGLPAAVVEKAIALARELHPFEQVIESRTGCTISSHCGPGCLGILYLHRR